jgi:plasmid stability protein
MATVTVRNLSESTRRALKERAARNDRSMEAEARAIIEGAVARPDHVAGWMERTRALRGEPLTRPETLPAREIDLA